MHFFFLFFFSWKTWLNDHLAYFFPFFAILSHLPTKTDKCLLFFLFSLPFNTLNTNKASLSLYLLYVFFFHFISWYWWVLCLFLSTWIIGEKKMDLHLAFVLIGDIIRVIYLESLAFSIMVDD